MDDVLEALSTPAYWDERYASADGKNPTHEWFRTYDALHHFFTKHLFEPYSPQKSPRILHLGSGDSTVPSDLAARGYQNQLCVDFSMNIVEVMNKRQVTGIEWQWMDVRDMKPVADSSVDVAFDKGTLDAMIYGSPWDPPDEVKSNTGRYVDEVFRVLKKDGVFLYITYRQPHFMKPLLNPDHKWKLELESLEDENGSFGYYGYILAKNGD